MKGSQESYARRVPKVLVLVLGGGFGLAVWRGIFLARRSVPFAQGLDFEFYACDRQRTGRWSQLSLAVGDEKFPVGIAIYTLLDLNHDGQKELICELDKCGADILILHRTEKGLYGYVCPFRGFKNLKEDGSYEGASSCCECGEYRVQAFLPTGMQEVSLWHNELSPKGELLHFIGEKQVSDAEFEAFYDHRPLVKEVEWKEWPRTPTIPEEVVLWLQEAGVKFLKPRPFRDAEEENAESLDKY